MQVAEDLFNPYKPSIMSIAGISRETPDVLTFSLRFSNDADASAFTGWKPGQFGEFTVFGVGESVFALSNAPWRRGDDKGADPLLQCTFRDVGKVTHALSRRSVGDVIGFRGPYGNSFPLDDWRGKDLVFIGGGLGMAALRSAMLEAIARKSEFGDIVILNGARSVADMVYKDHMPEWEATDGVRVVRTVDPGGETSDWDGKVGLIPTAFEEMGLSPKNRIVVACGPPIMLHFLFKSLEKMDYDPGQVVTTLENKMKCGVGICGRCNVGPFFVCRDGPVLTWAELNKLPQDF